MSQRDAEEWRRQEAWQQYYAQQHAAQNAHYDRLCLTPADQAQANWCAAREREKDRALQQEQWARQNAIEEHRLAIQRRELDLQRRERGRQVGRDISDAINRPFQQPATTAPRNCTSLVNGNLVTTSCF